MWIFSRTCLQEQSNLSYHYGMCLCACRQEVVFILKTPKNENESLKDTTGSA